MGKSTRVTVGLLLAACLVVGFLAVSAGRSTAPAEPAPAAPALEAGKRYSFYWERAEMVNATALGAPRGNWIRVRYRSEPGKETVHWVNLATVTHVAELPTDK